MATTISKRDPQLVAASLAALKSGSLVTFDCALVLYQANVLGPNATFTSAQAQAIMTSEEARKLQEDRLRYQPRVLSMEELLEKATLQGLWSQKNPKALQIKRQVARSLSNACGRWISIGDIDKVIASMWDQQVSEAEFYAEAMSKVVRRPSTLAELRIEMKPQMGFFRKIWKNGFCKLNTNMRTAFYQFALDWEDSCAEATDIRLIIDLERENKPAANALGQALSALNKIPEGFTFNPDEKPAPAPAPVVETPAPVSQAPESVQAPAEIIPAPAPVADEVPADLPDLDDDAFPRS